MAETAGRLLSLLSLLQTPREWPGPELARRLEVSTRTVRNDVERLRQLGYPVEATRGAVGGYRLAAGTAMPPLLLDDDEAVAVVVSLRTAAGQAVEGIDETALRALTKLQQVLPKRLRAQVEVLQAHMVRAGSLPRGPRVDGEVLTALAAAAGARELVRFRYLDARGEATDRRVEPYRLVSLGRRWYLLAYDLDRDDWRTFRVDRLEGLHSSVHRFALRPLPAEDVAAYVAARNRQVQQRAVGTVVMEAPAAEVAERIGPWGVVEPAGEQRCTVRLGGRTADDLAFWLGALGCDFTVVDSLELADAVRRLGERYARAVS
ncbi:putative DNA-binding transcriptional regulator YafY [Motilibacter rhizosphaerae]|uniref:Putative DNA-binding transcriptional regulator YafY n=1 Tax=Motilibacter rhizosphaerae TaxID=598652 RepID=A0A4V2F2V1_9ACTN|nr:WYL domain-containing protein [Motilibacter rhizosphaerae]RZS80174.1 putative DNA-binding transcriptional regulator YafY [Motilibacter rhizosphaerae]